MRSIFMLTPEPGMPGDHEAYRVDGMRDCHEVIADLVPAFVSLAESVELQCGAQYLLDGVYIPTANGQIVPAYQHRRVPYHYIVPRQLGGFFSPQDFQILELVRLEDIFYLLRSSDPPNISIQTNVLRSRYPTPIYTTTQDPIQRYALNFWDCFIYQE